MRAHWEAAADALLDALRPFASPHHALLHLPGPRPSRSGVLSDGLEGYARSFLLAAFRLAGASGEAPGDLVSRYADGLAAGTEEGGPESWPAITPFSQPMVEAASIALSLHETRAWLWDALPARVQERAVAWLSGSLGKPHVPSNWLLFQVVVNAFLKSVGAPHRQDEIDRNLDLVRSWHVQDGWISDGPGQAFDHYVGWALHLYPVLWSRIDPGAATSGRLPELHARLHRFLDDFRLLFAGDGAPLHQGRSLTYRFAAAAALWAGALAGATPLPPGETRRAASGALRHFLERGALRDGLLTLGWHREHLPMVQAYSGPASPYWASKGFLGLLLPATHPVWTAQEEPLAVERGDFCRAMPGPGFLVRGTARDGMVRVANHGCDHYPQLLSADDDPHYRKLAYSTHTAPGTGEEADALDLDAQVALLDAAGTPTRRARVHRIAVADRFGASCFFPRETFVHDGRAMPLWTERVETVSIARGAAEIRIHHVRSLSPRRVRDGAYAVAGDARIETFAGAGEAWARTASGLTSWVKALHGFDEAAVRCLEGADAFGPLSAVPFLATREPAFPEAVLVSLHVLAGAPDPDAWRGDVAEVRVEGRAVEIACADGERFFVQLVAPEPVSRALGGLRLEGAVRFARWSPDGSSFLRRA